jgi:hypothetical protein
MQVSGLGIDPITTAATVGTSFLSKMFGGGDVNYANNFSAQVGTGKKYLQTEADAYYARSSNINVSAQEIARLEFKAGRALSDVEVLTMVGKAPAPQLLPPGFPSLLPQSYQAPDKLDLPWPLIIGGGVAVLGIGAALFISRK